MDSTSLMLSVLFGAIGTGYFIYGKKQQKWVCLLAGIGLCAFPYFVSGVWASIGIGVALCAAPFLIRE